MTRPPKTAGIAGPAKAAGRNNNRGRIGRQDASGTVEDRGPCVLRSEVKVFTPCERPYQLLGGKSDVRTETCQRSAALSRPSSATNRTAELAVATAVGTSRANFHNS